jgi:hypothetical protein
MNATRNKQFTEKVTLMQSDNVVGKSKQHIKLTSVVPSLSRLRFEATFFFSSVDAERLCLPAGVVRCGVSSITSANSWSLSPSSAPVGLASETS